VHAVQLEMCWRCYLDEDRPQHWDAARGASAQALLRELLQSSIDWRPGRGEAPVPVRPT
jgi:N-formylglutamate deformylase